MYDVIIIGCGLAGMISARYFCDNGYKVLILEKRSHIGGNIYDEVDESGFLVQKYGPHCFFTDDERIKPYVERFVGTEDCFVKCKTKINGKDIPMPFNFESIDIIYDKTTAEELKQCLNQAFGDKKIVSVTDLLNCSDELIQDYGKFMYENEYKLYSAKQWGRDISEISPAVFHRVPVYLSYADQYQSSKYQFLPKGGFTKFSEELINSELIDVRTSVDAIAENIVEIRDNVVHVHWENRTYDSIPVLFTGELDALFEYKYGKLPYRSLEFIWKTIMEDEYHDTEIVAYPQADKITRVTEYKKLPVQRCDGKTRISIEIPVEYDINAPIGNEPYYPIKNDENDQKYQLYLEMSSKIGNLYLCGRLADYKYYNMDNVMIRAQETAQKIIKENLA